MLEAKGIQKNYGSLQVLRGVDLSVSPGEIVSIVGSSGAGKSTLLHILGSLDKADAGNIRIAGKNLKDLSGGRLAAFRNQEIGFIFQFHHLLPEFTALENVCIPAWIANKNKNSSIKRAKQLLEQLGLQDRMENKPNQLSGGEQQRVAVARALMNEPSIIMADEPTGNLDSENAKDLHQLFTKLRNDHKQTFLIVTHNEELAAMSDRIITMKDGSIVQQLV